MYCIHPHIYRQYFLLYSRTRAYNCIKNFFEHVTTHLHSLQNNSFIGVLLNSTKNSFITLFPLCVIELSLLAFHLLNKSKIICV